MEGELNLGLRYKQGQGVRKDMVAAAGWFRRAADRGWSEAQFELGRCLLLGQGVGRDVAAAAVLFHEAIDGGGYDGDAEVYFHLGEMYLDGTGVDQSTELATKHLRIAAAKGSPDYRRPALELLEWIARAATAPVPAAAAATAAAPTAAAAPVPNPCSFCGAPDATKLCGGCRAARYCDQGCQRKHWRGAHKANCGNAA